MQFPTLPSKDILADICSMRKNAMQLLGRGFSLETLLQEITSQD
jgi:hypothetical protein